MELLTSSAGLVSQWGEAGLTLPHWVDGNNPELVVDKGGKLQDNWVKVSRVSGQVLPPARLIAVLLELDQELCKDTQPGWEQVDHFLLKLWKCVRGSNLQLCFHVFWYDVISSPHLLLTLFNDPNALILQTFL